jgi:hypothetical protein
MKIEFKKVLHYLLPVLLFIVIAYAYFPGLLEGKRLIPNDTRVSMASSREIIEHREKFGEEPLWTNVMFSGMPAYLISTQYKTNLTRYVNRILEIGKRPASFLILCFISVYILLLVFKVNPWIAFIGAFAVSFTTNNFILLGAGHMTKVHTIAYMGGAVAGAILAFKGKKLFGGALFGLFVSLMFMSNHLQITFYTFLMLLVIGIVYLVDAIKKHTIGSFFSSVGVLVAALVFAIGSNFSNIYTTYEYSKFSTRSKTELTKNVENKTAGLDRDYITAWSYGRAESFTLLIPDFRNGGSADAKKGTDFYKQVQPLLKNQFMQSGYSASEASKTADRQVGSLFYWGVKPVTDGPAYHGAVICFFFVLGLFLLKGRDKWWLLSATLLALLLSWGRYFPLLTNFFIDYFPFYNKFRDTTTHMSVVQFTMPVLAVLAVNNIVKGDYNKLKIGKALLWSFGLTGGLSLIFAVIPSLAGSFSGPHDGQLPANLRDLLVESRISAFKADAFRSFVLIVLAFAGVWFYVKQKLASKYLVGALVLLVGIDFWFVNQRYLDNGDLTRPVKTAYEATAADKMLKQDNDPNYKVLNLAVSTFNDATTSNYHFSVGGYHGAKMRRYQELIENRLAGEIQYIGKNLKTMQLGVFGSTPALNMLNTKYVILNPQSQPLPNPMALGHAWFVNDVIWADDADGEIEALNRFNPKTTAVINRTFQHLLSGSSPKADSVATVELKEHRANYLKYETKSQHDGLVVFSEIYYPKGWDAYIDGEPVEHLNVNYVLRGLPVPSGSHVVEFRFHPQSYFVGNQISFASSLLLILVLLGSIVIELGGKKIFRIFGTVKD